MQSRHLLTLAQYVHAVRHPIPDEKKPLAVHLAAIELSVS